VSSIEVSYFSKHDPAKAAVDEAWLKGIEKGKGSEAHYILRLLEDELTRAIDPDTTKGLQLAIRTVRWRKQELEARNGQL
jgi:hypothetical protein